MIESVHIHEYAVRETQERARYSMEDMVCTTCGSEYVRFLFHAITLTLPH